jgi:thioredoxin reductase (NADPH)
MAVLEAKAGLASALGKRLRDESSLTVVSLCAAWCDTCNEFRAAFERIAAARPEMIFVWLDIEDDSAICGEIDVENFPTIAIYRGERPLHYGVSLPQEGTVARLIDELAMRTAALTDAPPAVLELPAALRRIAQGAESA